MDIIHPTLLIDEKRCRNNISFMAKKAIDNKLLLKPHFKTHQSAVVGEWFREEGIKGITVSSIRMAEYFSDKGWDDITIAFPCNIKAIQQLESLSKRINLTILAENEQTLKHLVENTQIAVGVLVELNAGGNRTGVEVEDYHAIRTLVDKINGVAHLSFKGFYSHFGHTYNARGEAEVIQRFRDSLRNINLMRHELRYATTELYIGDTPGCSLATDFKDVTTITPGNFVFYDVMQETIGSCKAENIAVAMACPVVSKNAKRKEIIIHGGAVHFSKESILIEDKVNYGKLVQLKADGIGTPLDGSLVALSQEHGILKVVDELFENIQIGTVVGILPVHSCLTADCMRGYKTFSGLEIDHV